MQTKHIDKLEELKGFEWEYKGKQFILYGENDLVLKQTDTFDNCGLLGSISLRYIGLLNLAELEFYGLKVVLNEKTKLTRKDKEFLEKDFYIARERDGRLYFYYGKPHISKCGTYWEVGKSLFTQIDEKLFSFITWESGKAWSKAELWN